MVQNNKKERSEKGIGNKTINDVESLLIKKVINSRHLFRFSESIYNSFSFKFEKKVGKMYDDSNCLLFPSATLALLSFLKFLKLEGLKIIFTPLDSDLNMDPKEIEKKITKKTKIIITAHLFGRKQKYINKISRIAKKNSIYLVEDIAQSFGVGTSGSMPGTYGDFAYCSLNRFKIISSGDGGFALTKNKKIFHGIQAMHDQGCIIENGKRKIPNNPTEGLSMRVNELTAAVAYAQVMKFSYIKKQVQKAYREVREIIRDLIKVDEINPEKGDIPYFYLFRSEEIKKEKHPPLLKSGWHYAGNIPYLKKEFNKQKRGDKKLAETEKILSETFSVGSGLIQEYLSTPIGLSINFDNKEKKIFIKNFKKII